MKPRCSNPRNRAMTMFEALLVVVLLAMLAVLLMPAVLPYHHHPYRINCVNNLKQIGLAYQIWAGDNQNKYPMEISVTNGGTMELAAAGNVVANFQILSNELSDPKILCCGLDDKRSIATNFSVKFTAKNISYFVAVDATAMKSPTNFLSGDDSFEISGKPVDSGLLELPRDAPVTWNPKRHSAGNILFADGNVTVGSQSMKPTLTYLLKQTGLATNRLALP